MTECICDFPSTCGGLGSLSCEGCGGDLCVCRCGGEVDCGGCEDCDIEDDYGDYDDYDDDGEPDFTEDEIEL